jgi:cystathionine gamma-synthase
MNERGYDYKEILKKLRLTEFANYLNVPIYKAVNYFFEDIEQVREYHEGTFRRARYGRYDNLTWEHAETLMANLENCEASLLFGSGMNAISTTILSICEEGAHVIYNNNCYRNINRFCQEFLPRFGIQATGISSISHNFIYEVADEIRDNTKVIILEIPSNPHTQLVDIIELKRAIKQRRDIILIIDSTFASPYNFKPSQYNADLVVQSCTKYLIGGGDAFAGSVSGSWDLIEKIRIFRNVLGGIISPENAYALVQGINTLTPRMEYYNNAGLRIAQYLEQHSKVRRVYYTGLQSHPQFSLAKSLLKGNGGVVSFELEASSEAVTKFIENLKIPFMATHFGGPFTTIEQYGIFTLYHMDEYEKEKIGVNNQLVRMCLGFEDINMLIDDLEQALSKV